MKTKAKTGSFCIHPPISQMKEEELKEERTLQFLKDNFIQVNGDEALVDLGINKTNYVLKCNYIEYVCWKGTRHFFKAKDNDYTLTKKEELAFIQKICLCMKMFNELLENGMEEKKAIINLNKVMNNLIEKKIKELKRK